MASEPARRTRCAGRRTPERRPTAGKPTNGRVLPPSLPRSRPVAGRASRPQKMKAAEIVIEEIRRVAKERAKGMTLDSPIAESGMDSLERMEILATLEERFGGRFPPEILPDLETTRAGHCGGGEVPGRRAPRRRRCGRRAEIPAGSLPISTSSPSTGNCGSGWSCWRLPGVGNPYFGVHQGITNDRTVIDGRELINFASYNYVGTSGDPAVRPRPKRRSIAMGPVFRPAGWPPARK